MSKLELYKVDNMIIEHLFLQYRIIILVTDLIGIDFIFIHDRICGFLTFFVFYHSNKRCTVTIENIH
jgi:hypothetical protein